MLCCAAFGRFGGFNLLSRLPYQNRAEAFVPKTEKNTCGVCGEGGGGEREKILAAIKGDKLGTHGTGLK